MYIPSMRKVLNILVVLVFIVLVSSFITNFRSHGQSQTNTGAGVTSTAHLPVYACQIGQNDFNAGQGAGTNVIPTCPAIPANTFQSGSRLQWYMMNEVTSAAAGGMANVAFYLGATQMITENANCVTGLTGIQPVFEGWYSGDIIIGAAVNPPSTASNSVIFMRCQYPVNNAQSIPQNGDNSVSIPTNVSYVPSIQLTATLPVGFDFHVDQAWVVVYNP